MSSHGVSLLIFVRFIAGNFCTANSIPGVRGHRQERPGKSLRVTGNRTPLRVQDVLQGDRPSTATPPSTAASPSVSPPQTANGVRSEVQDSDGLMPEMAEGVSSIDPMTSDRLTVDGDTELPNSTEAGEPAQIGSGDLPRRIGHDIAVFAEHGVVTICPSPLHAGQGWTLTNWPRNVLDTWRNSPVPLQVAHVSRPL